MKKPALNPALARSSEEWNQNQSTDEGWGYFKKPLTPKQKRIRKKLKAQKKSRKITQRKLSGKPFTGPKRILYDVISPDGFSINMNAMYRSPDAAEKARMDYRNRFDHQGYYLDGNREQISLDELHEYMSVEKLIFTEREVRKFDLTILN